MNSPGASNMRAILDPRLLLRWIYIVRLSIASSVFIAAVLVWTRVDTETTRIASVLFALTAVVTVISAGYSEVYRRPLTRTFLYLQSVFDLLLVTAVVHITDGPESQFSALYILVIASASLLLPAGGVLLVAALGNVLFFADAVWFQQSSLDLSVWLQLVVFALVALGTAFLSNQLRRGGEGRDVLVAELQHERLRAEEILRNIRSGVITVDAHGRLLYANPSAADLLGIDLPALLGRPALEAVGRTAPELARAVERAIHDRVGTMRREGVVSTVAKRFPVGVTTTSTEPPAREDADRERTVTAIFQDISDQKRIDALRIRAERLEGVAELSASLAHEIKNPLASIRSAVEQLARMPRASDDERTLGELVLRESDRLSRLLSEFLDYSRVRVATTRPVDLGRVAAEAAALVESHPDCLEGVRIVRSIATEHVSVDGDDDLLHRAVFNLLLNAVQATPPGGEVRIEVAPGADEVSEGNESAFEMGAVVVRVTDEGPGIPPELRDRLFDPFFTTRPGGSGLGLAIVHRAIEAHRGLVLVDSGAGTRFTIVLPRGAAAGSASASAAPALTAVS